MRPDKEVIEDKPTPATKKKWARLSNYSVDEDEALVNAWESVSLDPVIGVDQNVKLTGSTSLLLKCEDTLQQSRSLFVRFT